MERQVCAAVFPWLYAQLPGFNVGLHGRMVRMCVDSCSTRSIVVRRQVRFSVLRRADVNIVMLNGKSLQGVEMCDVSVNVRGKEIILSCVVVEELPGCELLIGLDGIKMLQGVYIAAEGDVTFGFEQKAARVVTVCNVGVDVQSDDRKDDEIVMPRECDKNV